MPDISGTKKTVLKVMVNSCDHRFGAKMPHTDKGIAYGGHPLWLGRSSQGKRAISLAIALPCLWTYAHHTLPYLKVKRKSTPISGGDITL